MKILAFSPQENQSKLPREEERLQTHMTVVYDRQRCCLSVFLQVAHCLDLARNNWGSRTTSCFTNSGWAEGPWVIEEARKLQRRGYTSSHMLQSNRSDKIRQTPVDITKGKHELIKHHHRNGENNSRALSCFWVVFELFCVVELLKTTSEPWDHIADISLVQNLPASDQNVNVWGNAPGCILLFQSFACFCDFLFWVNEHCHPCRCGS